MYPGKSVSYMYLTIVRYGIGTAFGSAFSGISAQRLGRVEFLLA
jgi:hypothetical protein